MAADQPAWRTQQAETWMLSLPCTRAEAERLAEGLPELDALDPPPAVLVTEPDPALPDRWRLDAYFEGAPSEEALALVRGLAAGGDSDRAVPQRIEDRDWVTISQAWLEPIRAGRFHVHTAAHAGSAPPGAIAFHIEAGRAFGTGHHETTAGCLELLDRMALAGRRFAAIADIGTGTGLLAFAARALWPQARLIASDIDPISIEVAAANMIANAIPEDAIALVAADGMGDARLAAAAPFDLLIANILAGPLIALAPDFAAATAPGGVILLAGLLATQAGDVAAAYAEHGFIVADRIDRGEWPTLAFVQRP